MTALCYFTHCVPPLLLSIYYYNNIATRARRLGGGTIGRGGWWRLGFSEFSTLNGGTGLAVDRRRRRRHANVFIWPGDF